MALFSNMLWHTRAWIPIYSCRYVLTGSHKAMWHAFVFWHMFQTCADTTWHRCWPCLYDTIWRILRDTYCHNATLTLNIWHTICHTDRHLVQKRKLQLLTYVWSENRVPLDLMVHPDFPVEEPWWGTLRHTHTIWHWIWHLGAGYLLVAGTKNCNLLGSKEALTRFPPAPSRRKRSMLEMYLMFT